MTADVRAARIIGLILLLQLALGPVVNFVLEGPLFGSPGFLVSAADHARQIGLAALLAVFSESLSVAIAVLAYPTFHQRSRALAVLFVAITAANLAVAFAENASVMSMVSVSQAYAAATDPVRAALETVRIIVASARNWAHYMGRLSDGLVLLVFYGVLLRFSLVPRLLAGAGVLAVALMLASIAQPFFGHAVVFPMLAPLGLVHLSLAAWLIIKGFGPSQGVGQPQPK